MSKYERIGERGSCVVNSEGYVDMLKLTLYVTDPKRQALLKEILDSNDSPFSAVELFNLRLHVIGEL